MITVHHLEYSRSQRILWLLEELGLPYEVKLYKRLQSKMAPPEMKAVHPLGKSPILTDDDIVAAESGAIIEYLLDRYDERNTLRPAPGAVERLPFNYWLHYAEGSLMPPLLVALLFGQIQKARLPFFAKPVARGIVSRMNAIYIRPQLALHFGFMEQELQKNSWFAGPHFTAADIQMSYPIEAGLSRGMNAAEYPRLHDFVKRIHERPAWKKAEARVGDFGTPI